GAGYGTNRTRTYDAAKRQCCGGSSGQCRASGNLSWAGLMFDGKAFGLEVVSAVKAHIDRSLLPIVARLDALEAEFRNLPPARDGAPGKDADIGEILGVVDQRIAALAANPVDMDLVDAKIERS